MSDTEMLSTRPLRWCTRKVFWGSHGCTLGDHEGDVHECAVVKYNDDGSAGEASPCCQCRTLDGQNAEVRHWDWQRNGWSDWNSGWSWFS